MTTALCLCTLSHQASNNPTRRIVLLELDRCKSRRLYCKLSSPRQLSIIILLSLTAKQVKTNPFTYGTLYQKLKYNSFTLNVPKYHKTLQYFKGEAMELEAWKTWGPLTMKLKNISLNEDTKNILSRNTPPVPALLWVYSKCSKNTCWMNKILYVVPSNVWLSQMDYPIYIFTEKKTFLHLNVCLHLLISKL